MKHFSLLALALIILTVPVWADTYKWTDAEGNVHYSDNPPSDVDAQPVTMPKLNRMTPPAAKPTPPKADKRYQTPGSGSPKHVYQGLAISQPADQANLWADNGEVSVTISVSPRLFPGDTVLVLLDGNRMNQPAHQLTYTLSGVDPGQHSLMAVVLDQNGNVLARAPAVTIYVHHHSILRKH